MRDRQLRHCPARKRLELPVKREPDCHGEGEASEDPVATVRERYARGGGKDGDEFLTPIIVGGDESRIKGMSFHSQKCSGWC
ncbi:MAG: hypothetical protein B7X99_12485 [Rhizobiales bacterium 17-65-6]|nr:MAG: hypothetical protein B7X99_12485 [Rhizobiales bacterium 17-65-6]